MSHIYTHPDPVTPADRTYEPDRVQCQAITSEGKRCTQIARHSNGGKVLCPRQHLMVVATKMKEKK